MVIVVKYNDEKEHTFLTFTDILSSPIDHNDITSITIRDFQFCVPLPILSKPIGPLICKEQTLPFALPKLTDEQLCPQQLPNAQVHAHIAESFCGNYMEYFKHLIDMKKEAANKIGEQFLICKFDPEYKYCKNRIRKEWEDSYNIPEAEGHN
jgi:hypothetical protein